jgi:hypothetical protein
MIEEELFHIRLVGIVKVNVKISGDKKFSRSSISLRDNSLNVNEILRKQQKNLRRTRKWMTDLKKQSDRK